MATLQVALPRQSGRARGHWRTQLRRLDRTFPLAPPGGLPFALIFIRPQLLHGVGRVTQSGRQTTLTVTSTHEKAAQTQARQSWVGRFLGKLREIAEQLTRLDTWRIILSRVYFRFLKGHIIGTSHAPDLPPLEAVNCGF